MPTRFLINQCQIIAFLILKSDNIGNSRIELKGIVLQVRSNQIKVTFIIILPFNLVHLSFFPVSQEIEGKCGWIIGGQRVCCPPPLKLLGGAWPPASPPPPLPTPMKASRGKRTTQKDTIKDITSDSQVYRWSTASLTFNIYLHIFLFLYITRITINNDTPTKTEEPTWDGQQ